MSAPEVAVVALGDRYAVLLGDVVVSRDTRESGANELAEVFRANPGIAAEVYRKANGWRTANLAALQSGRAEVARG